MESSEVLPACRALGIELTLNSDVTRIRARPARHLTPELEDAIRKHRDEIMRTLCFRRAVLWLHGRMAAEGAGSDDPARDAAWSALSENEALALLNEAWLDADLETFRRVLTDRTRAALAAFREAQNHYRREQSRASESDTPGSERNER